MSRCSIFFLWRSLNPSIICRAKRQTTSSATGFPICILRNCAKSPPLQYSIQMYNFSFSMKDCLYFTMYYESMFFIILTSFIACIEYRIPTISFFYPLIWARLLWWRRWVRLLWAWLCRRRRMILSLVCWVSRNLLNSYLYCYYNQSLIYEFIRLIWTNSSRNKSDRKSNSSIVPF